jgi:hypothetical protein
MIKAMKMRQARHVVLMRREMHTELWSGNLKERERKKIN